MKKVRQINRAVSEISDTCLDGQLVKSSEEGQNMVSFMTFEDESCS